MRPLNFFVSYCHADEWLRLELVTHLSALKRNGTIAVWHDRLIPPGGIIDEQVDAAIDSTDIFLLLVSPDFIASEYCFTKEYQAALGRYDEGKSAIIPVIVRDCDWDVGRLRSFKAMPTDGRPVTRDAVSRSDNQQRDLPWTDVVSGIKATIEDVKKKMTPPILNEEYLGTLFLNASIKHPLASAFDDNDVFIDPNIYHENSKAHLANFEAFISGVSGQKAAIITGGDTSGKTIIAKKLQVKLTEIGRPAILLRGDKVRNADILRLAKATASNQFLENTFPLSKFTLIIDDFDECNLPDTVKETIIRVAVESFSALVVTSYSGAPAVLFTPDSLPDPDIYQINPLGDEKLLDIVHKWKSIGKEDSVATPDTVVLAAYNTLSQLFVQARIDKFPSSAVTFLQYVETMSGADIAASSFAACYEALVNTKITSAGSGWRAVDEAKNFLSFVAYAAYVETGEHRISEHAFETCLEAYSEQYLSDVDALSDFVLENFMTKRDGAYRFSEEYLWYFLCARHVAKNLSRTNSTKYVAFIDECTSQIFMRKYANIIVFISYFSNDNQVIESLLTVVDGLFCKADGWVLSDASRTLMLGLTEEGPVALESSPDVSDNRREMLRQKVINVIEDAEGVVTRYALPFLDDNIEDSEYIEQIDVHFIDADSYMRSANALMRVHSVLGQILASRPGTFETSILLNCIERMVKASGRYIRLNHAIAAVLSVDKERSLHEVDRAVDNIELSPEEKLEKVERIFSFWSVYLSQAGLARYLNNDHSIRGLQLLSGRHESAEHADENGNIPYNFSSVLAIAELYRNGKINRQSLEDIILKYGDKSAFISLLRMVLHIYAYYMPMSIEDKQWVSGKLRMSLRYLEAQRRKALTSGRSRS